MGTNSDLVPFEPTPPKVHKDEEELLYIEEMSQFQALDGFNALIKVQLASRYLMSASPSNSSTAKYARPGELFGRIELHSELSEDSKAGRLILTKCNSIMMK